MQIPTEKEWNIDLKDRDAKYALEIFQGLTLEEAQREFRLNVIERCENLRRMPEIPFQFYMIAFKNYIESDDFRDFDAPDSASCFINLIAEVIQDHPSYIKPIISELISVAEKVASNQEKYEADLDIYGDFNDVLKLIKERMAQL